MALEQEVKLAFASLEAARSAVHTAEGRLVRSRRLIEDRLFDDDEGRLGERGSALRLRLDGDRSLVTWKGPARPGPVKAREELQTSVENTDTMSAILGALGYQPRFRSQKYREEYEIERTLVTIDEAPCGIFVEIEGPPDSIATVARALGRSPADFRLESYPTLWRQFCETQGRPFGDMLFAENGGR